MHPQWGRKKEGHYDNSIPIFALVEYAFCEYQHKGHIQMDLIARLWEAIIRLIAHGVRPQTLLLLTRINLIFGLAAIAGTIAYQNGSRSPVAQALIGFFAILMALSFPLRGVPCDPTIRAWAFFANGALLFILPSVAAFVTAPRRDTQRKIIRWSHRFIIAILILNIFVR